MIELNPEHLEVSTKWSDYIKARIAGQALKLAEWVGERTEVNLENDDE